MKNNLTISHYNDRGQFVSVVNNLDNDKLFIIGRYNSIESRHKLEKLKLKKMIEKPSEQFKRFLYDKNK
mgnify:CR=1 FL=1|tara:strand:+ start:24 stop:230 length:207 start_codon:yes stop_codon:yes gene_type:complete